MSEIDGYLWRPSEKSNRWNFTKAINHERRSYPPEALFVPVVFAGEQITYAELRTRLEPPPSEEEDSTDA